MIRTRRGPAGACLLGSSSLIFSSITPGFPAAGAALFDASEQFLAPSNLADVSPPHAACSPEDCCLRTYIRCRMSCSRRGWPAWRGRMNSSSSPSASSCLAGRISCGTGISIDWRRSGSSSALPRSPPRRWKERGTPRWRVTKERSTHATPRPGSCAGC